MATLLLDARDATPTPILQTSVDVGIVERSEFLKRTVPTPFPSAAEREMEEELERLAREEVNIWDGDADAEESVGESSKAAVQNDAGAPLPTTSTDPSTTDAGPLNDIAQDLSQPTYNYPLTSLSQAQDLLPSIGHVQTACLTALNDLFSPASASPLSALSPTSPISTAKWKAIVPDRRHSLPPLNPNSMGTSTSASQSTQALQKLVWNLRLRDGEPSASSSSSSAAAMDDAALVKEIQHRVSRAASSSEGERDADLARTLASLLGHLSRASSTQTQSQSSALPSSSAAPPRVASWDVHHTSMSTGTDPYASLRRQVSDLQLERAQSEGDETVGEGEGELWREIDRELEVVLGLCRARSINIRSSSEYPLDRADTESVRTLPPEYDPEDYLLADVGGVDSLPRYEAGDHASLSSGSAKAKTSLDGQGVGVGVGAGTDEKMRMDLEAVTLAIDRLYLVAPQLHNQRVELGTRKREEMERARRSVGPLTLAKEREKGKAKDVLGIGAENDVRELNKILELVGKAAERKMVDQSVVLDAAFSQRMERARQEDIKRKTAFVETLARHSDAGRLHAQEAVFLTPSSRSQSQSQLQQPKTLDPYALLTLPEFIREGIPEDVHQEMERRREQTQDADALLTLPEFIKRYPKPELASPQPQPQMEAVKAQKRSRSVSEPLAWLLSGSRSPARSASPSGGGEKGAQMVRKKSRLGRPKSSTGFGGTVHEGLDVTYVAEHHENLQHVLAFLSVPGLDSSSGEIEAEVVPASTASMDDERDVLVLSSGPRTSQPLALPAAVREGKAEVSASGQHYQIKLPCTPFSSPPQASTSSYPGEFLDASHFTSISPITLICTSCSLPLVQSSRLSKYRDLPSEHWAELVDAWMCHADLKLNEHVQQSSREGFWPGEGEALVGGSYVLVRGEVVVCGNVCEVENPAKSPFDDWTRIRCICGALLGRSQQHPSEEGCTVYRLAKYAFRPISPTAEPIRVPLSAYVVEDMNEFVHAHATYRFVIVDEEEERARLLIWLFKPNMRISYTTPAQYVIPKSGSIRAAKVLFKILGPTSAAELPGILNRYPGFPQAEHLYYPRDVCRRLGAVLRESNTAYPESMRTMTGLDVGWLQRA